ncbi:hypothetical protein PWY87_34105 [Kribbella solani]|nr:hypothetical protein [Kribbella solani]MDX3006751.1 hypothetical protein [Kribbella solani]
MVGQHRGYHRDETGDRWTDAEDVPSIFRPSMWERHDDPEMQ